jgi:hypothetical protein
VKPRRPIERVTSAVEDVAGALRRRREGRELRIRAYDAAGRVRAIDPGSAEGERIVEAADALLTPAERP